MESETHTIDNLNKKDKAKVIEMLKQLNELRKRCACLESQIENQIQENTKLSQRNDMIMHKVESTEAQLFDTINISEDTQSQIEKMTLTLQRVESDVVVIRQKADDAEVERETLQNSLNILRQKYDHIHVDTSVQHQQSLLDKVTNTVCFMENFQDEESQIPERTSSTQRKSTFITDNDNNNIESSTQISFVESFDDEADEDINNIIMMLNAKK